MSDSTEKFITIPLSKTGKHAGKYETKVSIEDADLKEISLQVSIEGKNNYATLKGIRNGKKTTLRIHRIVMERILNREIASDELIDHINGDGLDNRRSNLRITNSMQNCANSTFSRGNTKYRGVHYMKPNRKYKASISVNNKKIHLGLFETAEEAFEVYKKASIQYHGKYSPYSNDE